MMKRLAALSTLFLCAFNAAAELTVSALDASSRILYVGETVQIQILVYNAVPSPLEGELTIRARDFWGRQVAELGKPILIPAGDDSLVTLNPALTSPGYFAIDAIVKSGDNILLEKDDLWSVAIMKPGLSVPPDSPFGTYTIGNTKMLADIVPRGFYGDMSKMGAKWGTIDTWWSRIEVERGNCDWTYYEQWFEAARNAGILPIPHLFGMPKWISSRPEHKDYWAYPPSDWSVWERFVEDFVTRNRDWLIYLRIWNEPNCGYWQGTRAEYAQLLIHASQAAKRVKPDIKIIMEAAANPALDVIPFFDDVDAAGATPHWDILAVHNYWLNNKECPERTPFLKVYRDLLAWRGAHKPAAEVWDTEFACMADNWGTEWIGVGETKQAQWLVRAHLLGFSLGLNKMFWFPGYSWPDPTTAPFFNPSGLLRADLSPRPAYVAYHTIATALSTAKYEASLPLGPERYALTFKVSEGCLTVLWSTDKEHGGSVTLKVKPGSEAESTNIMGQNETLKFDENGMLSVAIDEDPVFLKTELIPAL